MKLFSDAQVSLLALLALLSVTLPLEASRGGSPTAATRPRVAPQQRSRGRTNGVTSQRSDEEQPYYWMCPEVRCTPVAESCAHSEFIVLEYQYEVRGKGTVNVRCQSCPYCLDMPAVGRRQASTAGMCPENLECPLLPDTCENVQPTIVQLAGQPCRLCPACYDHTVVTQHRGGSTAAAGAGHNTAH